MDDLTIEHYTNHPNYFLTMSQSARVLGNKDYRIVERLIEKGFLKAFSLPGTKRILLRYHDVMSLPKYPKKF